MSSSSQIAIGAHVEQTDPVAEAQARETTLVQFFLGDPQGYKGPEIRYAGGADGLRADAEAAGVDLYVHAPYIVNVATTNNRIRIPSRKLLQQHMDAAAEIGAKGLIVHGGHVNKDDDPAKGFDNWRKAVEATDIKIPLLIENTAGGDNAMTRHLDRIAGVWDAISAGRGLRGGRLLPRHLPRLGRAASSWPPRWRRSARSPAGSTCVHANDSRDAFDSGADRHANFGAGQLDADDFAGVVRDAGAPGDLRDPRRRRRAPGRLRVAARARRLSAAAQRAGLLGRGAPAAPCSPAAASDAVTTVRHRTADEPADPLRRRPADQFADLRLPDRATRSARWCCSTAATGRPGYGLDQLDPLAEC